MLLYAISQIFSNLFFFALHATGISSFPPPLDSKTESALVAAAAEGDTAARQKLVEHNLRLVAHITKKYYNNGVDTDDLISIGTIGLIKAISTYRGDKGIRLATYAARCVENEILMHFRAQKKSSQDVSLSDYIETSGDGAPLALMDVVADQEDLCERVSNRELLQKLCKAVDTVLSEQERQVVVLRYGLGNQEPMRQREVAQATGISRSYVSRIEKKALQKLKAALD